MERTTPSRIHKANSRDFSRESLYGAKPVKEIVAKVVPKPVKEIVAKVVAKPLWLGRRILDWVKQGGECK